jgi:hypothetical protein
MIVCAPAITAVIVALAIAAPEQAGARYPLRRLLWLCQARRVVQRIEMQAHDGNDLFRLHQVGPESGVHS